MIHIYRKYVLRPLSTGGRLFAIAPVFMFIFLNVSGLAQEASRIETSWSRDLPGDLTEISGLVKVDTLFFAINDSGNEPLVWILDEKLEVLRSEKVSGLTNADWEDISYSNGYLYIGDFGNNFGNRKDLKIYRVSLADMLDGDAVAKSIPFSYALQKKFSYMPKTHTWDCEAMLAVDGALLLYSKDWPANNCRMYKLDYSTGAQSLRAVDSLNTGFLVTGASLDTETGLLWMCGYLDRETYLIAFENHTDERIGEPVARFIVDDLKKCQVESIFVNSNRIWIASERSSRKQAVYRIDLK